jgi:hypothetical protein
MSLALLVSLGLVLFISSSMFAAFAFLHIWCHHDVVIIVEVYPDRRKLRCPRCGNIHLKRLPFDYPFPPRASA